MTYPHLPPVGSLAAPPLPFEPSPNHSPRNGRTPRLVFLHTWGGGSFDSTVRWLKTSRGKQAVSAHIVYGGINEAVQLVPFADKAWTECDLNPVGISVECADAIWTGHDPGGFAQLARLTALLCHLHLDACRYVTAHGILQGSHGFTRHSDGGVLGCNHPSCPTTDMALWDQFAGRVVAEWRHGGFRDEYGR